MLDVCILFFGGAVFPLRRCVVHALSSVKRIHSFIPTRNNTTTNKIKNNQNNNTTAKLLRIRATRPAVPTNEEKPGDEEIIDVS